MVSSSLLLCSVVLAGPDVTANQKLISFEVCADLSMTISATQQTLVNAKSARVVSLESAGTVHEVRFTSPSSLSGLTGRNDRSKRNDTMMMLSLVCPV